MAETKAPAKKPTIPTLQQKFCRIFDATDPENGSLAEQLIAAGVNFDPICEAAVEHTTFWQRTKDGTERLIWIYESDLTVRWTNSEKPSDQLEATIHTIGSSSKGPADAKAAAWDHSLGVYFGHKFHIIPEQIIVHEEDAASYKGQQEPPQRPAEPRNSSQGINTQPPAKTAPAAKNTARRTLTGPQMDRMYKKAEAAGITMQQVDAEILSKYNAEDPHTITRQQYDEICRRLDDAARNRQGGQINE